MKTAVQAVKVFVGLLFIVSGLVKANDPLGLSYKMQEFFEVWRTSLAGSGFFAKNGLISLLDAMHSYTLALAIIMITLEILAGVALLIGWRKRFVLTLLLILILFFTFLTAYAYGSGKFKNCGCFGDCIPITPLTSLIKDLVLLAMILFLLFTQRYIQPAFGNRLSGLILFLSLVATLALQWYVLNYLPIADCLPFKKNNNISEQMKPPKGSRPDSIAMVFIYEKDGKKHEFSINNLPTDTSYKYVDREDKVIRKGNATPPISGFVLTGITGTDSTEAILQHPHAILIFAEHFNNSAQWVYDLAELKRAAAAKEIPIFFATTTVDKVRQMLLRHQMPDIPVFSMDFTIVKTVARTNPTVLRLNQGVIVDKYGYREFDKLTAKLK